LSDENANTQFRITMEVFCHLLPEPAWGPARISNRVLDVCYGQVGLQRPGVLAIAGKLEAASMTNIVRMGLEWKVEIPAALSSS
jgi:hypothetical protein